MWTAAVALTVALCDQVGLDNDTWMTAKTKTINIFANAGVALQWFDSDQQHKQCKLPSTGNYIVIVLVDEAPKGWTSVDALGFAPQLTNRAYVFYKRVRSYIMNFRLTENEHTTIGVIIGHAIAHELGHLLIPGDAHGNGIMRAQWTYEEWRRAFDGTLVFNPDHARAIQLRLGAK